MIWSPQSQGSGSPRLTSGLEMLEHLPGMGRVKAMLKVGHLNQNLNHCCYQVAFQEINILFSRVHLVNVKVSLTESLYEKNYFSETIKVISNLTNIHGTILSGQTYVQKWLLDCGHFYGRFWPFYTLMAIFTNQTGVRFVSFRPIVAHGGQEDSHTTKSVRAIKMTDVALKVCDASLAITMFGHNF